MSSIFWIGFLEKEPFILFGAMQPGLQHNYFVDWILREDQSPRAGIGTSRYDVFYFFELVSLRRNHSFCVVLCSQDCSTIILLIETSERFNSREWASDIEVRCLLFFELDSLRRNHSFCLVLCSQDCSTIILLIETSERFNPREWASDIEVRCPLFFELDSLRRNHPFCLMLCSEHCSTLIGWLEPQRGSPEQSGVISLVETSERLNLRERTTNSKVCCLIFHESVHRAESRWDVRTSYIEQRADEFL